MPEISEETWRLEVEGRFDSYTAVALAKGLPHALAQISTVPGRMDVEVNRIGDRNACAITITARHLLERFDPSELRRVIQERVDLAVEEGALRTREHADQVLEFLDAFADSA